MLKLTRTHHRPQPKMKFTLLSSIILFSASLIGAQNPLPQGTYQIFNRVLDPAGKRLALTFNGNNTAITMQPASHNPNQLWLFTGFFSSGFTGNSIAPLISPGFQVAMTAFPGTLIALPAGSFFWPSTNIDGSFQMSDGSFKFFWGVDNVTDGAAVQVSQMVMGDLTQLWVPVKVD